MLTPTMPDSSGDLKPNRNNVVTDPAELAARCRQGLNSKVPKFTRKVLAALVPAENGKDVFVSTAELPYYYIRVTKDGHCSYCIQHRVPGRATIGDVRVKTIDDALKRARAILDAARDGRNLLAEEKEGRRQKQAAQTILTIRRQVPRRASRQKEEDLQAENPLSQNALGGGARRAGRDCRPARLAADPAQHSDRARRADRQLRP